MISISQACGVKSIAFGVISISLGAVTKTGETTPTDADVNTLTVGVFGVDGWSVIYTKDATPNLDGTKDVGPQDVYAGDAQVVVVANAAPAIQAELAKAKDITDFLETTINLADETLEKGLTMSSGVLDVTLVANTINYIGYADEKSEITVNGKTGQEVHGGGPVPLVRNVASIALARVTHSNPDTANYISKNFVLKEVFIASAKGVSNVASKEEDLQISEAISQAEKWKARADQEQTRAKDQEQKLLEEQLNLKKTLQKKGLQASEAISQAEEWKNQAEKSEIQIQKLLSDKQELVSTVAEQGKRIAEQTEQIEKLNEADNVLKLNAELKKQNEKLKQDKLNAEQEAEATVSSVKREYEAKGRELDRRIGEAAKQSASLKSERQSISEDIEQRATAKYLDQKKELDRKFKAQTASYDSFLLGLLLYGVLTTVFTAVRSEAFKSDFKTFFMVIWQFIVNAFQLLLKGGQWVSQLGDKIPQPVVATIAHYLLLIVFVGGIAIGVGFLIFLGASKVFEFYTEDYADTMSLAVFLISLAVSVYFAEPIRAVIPINLLLLLILVHIVYVLIGHL